MAGFATDESCLWSWYLDKEDHDGESEKIRPEIILAEIQYANVIHCKMYNSSRKESLNLGYITHKWQFYNNA